ncbi:hypothetical protein C8Q72DRAFT_924218 [Fomitopsis betulina]|nr:hypothetical protein C8Q72DRAFT_924218 [Fomitopsis betulina]
MPRTSRVSRAAQDPRYEAHMKAALDGLSSEEETALVDWLEHNALSGRPFSRKTLESCVYVITGEKPGKRWHRRFEKHHPELSTARPVGLDPKRAQNFNRTAVQGYYALRTALIVRYGPIPPEQEWNIDEKAIQMGGGVHTTCYSPFV